MDCGKILLFQRAVQIFRFSFWVVPSLFSFPFCLFPFFLFSFSSFSAFSRLLVLLLRVLFSFSFVVLFSLTFTVHKNDGLVQSIGKPASLYRLPIVLKTTAVIRPVSPLNSYGNLYFDSNQWKTLRLLIRGISGKIDEMEKYWTSASPVHLDFEEKTPDSLLKNNLDHCAPAPFLVVRGPK